MIHEKNTPGTHSTNRIHRPGIAFEIPVLAERIPAVEPIIPYENARTAFSGGDEKFRALLEISNDAIFLMKKDRFIECNDRALEIFNCDRTKIINMTPDSFSPPEQIDGIPSRIAAAKRIQDALNGKEQKFGWVHRTGDGTNFKAQVSLKAIETGREKMILAIVRDVTERNQLIREVHHRVKNNLQVITSLMNLQKHYFSAKGSDRAFDECTARIMTIAAIHENLYRSSVFSRIDFSTCVPEVIQHARQLTGTGERVEISCDAHDVILGIEHAVPCALIINELVVNALRHAFTGKERGKISIIFNRISGEEYLLVVRDNGAGIPGHVDLKEPRTLGFTLVEALVKQLNGRMEYNGSAGAEFTMRLSLNTNYCLGVSRKIRVV